MILASAKPRRRKTHPMIVATARIPTVRSSSQAVGSAGQIAISRNVYLRSQCDEPFCQRRFAPEMPPLQTASPDYDFGHVREPRIFRNLRRYIFSVCCDDFCTKLLRQTHIRLQSNGVFRVHISVSGCLHIECGKASAKCLRHFFCHSYNAFIGWRRGQAHQNMLF